MCEVRLVNASDEARLAVFCCSQSPAQRHEEEVENYIRSSLFSWSQYRNEPYPDQARDYEDRRLLILDGPSGELVGVAAHHRLALGLGEEEFDGRVVYVIALAREFWGAADDAGVKCSDRVMAGVLSDARVSDPANPMIVAFVHPNNSHSFGLFARHGYTDRAEQENGYYLVSSAAD